MLTSTSVHPHHYVLPPNRRSCWGVCRTCGIRKHFPTLLYRCTGCKHDVRSVHSFRDGSGWQHVCKACVIADKEAA